MNLAGVSAESRLFVTLTDEAGENTTETFDVPVITSRDQLEQMLYVVLQLSDDDRVPYSFYVEDKEIFSTLDKAIDWEKVNVEKPIDIVYHAQAVFRVRPVSRCTSTLEGHQQPVLHALFSPTGSTLASGSGDKSVRIWDLTTETPKFTCEGHMDWVLALAWSPDGHKLASGCKRGVVILWRPIDGSQMGKKLTGHKQWISYLAWEPLHRNGDCRRLASASKDCDIRVWDTATMTCEKVLAGHVQGVTCIKWSGTGAIYSASQDRTIRVWDPDAGICVKQLHGHGHWVNTLALNTDYCMRIGAFDPKNASINPLQMSEDPVHLQKTALAKYSEFINVRSEKLVSGSDDFTLFLWEPTNTTKSVARMTGHQALINDVRFSPDGRLLASGSFDKSIKVWNGKDGKFLYTLRGHITSVYQLSWSADSRLLVSASEDSTVKLWQNGKLLMDLPGHLDQVYTVDWSPDGQAVASGSKDKTLKLWRR